MQREKGFGGGSICSAAKSNGRPSRTGRPRIALQVDPGDPCAEGGRQVCGARRTQGCSGVRLGFVRFSYGRRRGRRAPSGPAHAVGRCWAVPRMRTSPTSLRLDRVALKSVACAMSSRDDQSSGTQGETPLSCSRSQALPRICGSQALPHISQTAQGFDLEPRRPRAREARLISCAGRRPLWPTTRSKRCDAPMRGVGA